MRPVSRCLNNQLAELCLQAMQLDELNAKLKDYLPKHLAEHCRVGAFNRGCLMLSIPDASWATELRYLIPELRDQLRKAGLYGLLSIKIAIATPELATTPVKRQRKQAQLSAAAKNSIRTAGELCSYAPLREALYHLARGEDE